MQNPLAGQSASVAIRGEARKAMAPRIEALSKTGMSDAAIAARLSVSQALVGHIRKEFVIKAGGDYRKELAQQSVIDAWNEHRDFDKVLEVTGLHHKTVRVKLREYHRDGLIEIPRHLQKTQRKQFIMPVHNHASKENGIRKRELGKGTFGIRESYFLPRMKEKTPDFAWEFVEQAMRERA